MFTPSTSQELHYQQKYNSHTPVAAAKWELKNIRQKRHLKTCQSKGWQQSLMLRFLPRIYVLYIHMNLNNRGKRDANTFCHRGGRFMSQNCSLLNILIWRHLQFINPTSYSVMPGVIMCCDGVSSGVCSSSSSLTDRPLNESREALQHDQRLKNALITVHRPSVWAASLISVACVYCQYGI